MTTDTPLSKEDLVSRLRLHQNKITNAAWMREMCRNAADCIEQLQMSPAKVRELANSDEGADTLALLRALGMQVEGQRKALTDLRASLIREQNAVKVMAGENERLRIALNVAAGENEG
jgi:pantoate kinase